MKLESAIKRLAEAYPADITGDTSDPHPHTTTCWQVDGTVVQIWDSLFPNSEIPMSACAAMRRAIKEVLGELRRLQAKNEILNSDLIEAKEKIRKLEHGPIPKINIKRKGCF